ncbi:MAG: VWA domain-containing protein [Planctomycetota bacterium]
MNEVIGWQWLRPMWLWLLVPALPWLALYYVRSLSDFAAWQRVFSLLLRIVVVSALIMALAGLIVLVGTERQMIVVAIDRSQSIDDAAWESAMKTARDLRDAVRDAEDVEARFLLFDQTVGQPSSDVENLFRQVAHQPNTASQPDRESDQPIGTATADDDDDSVNERRTNVTEKTPQPQSGESAYAHDEPRQGTDIALAIRTAIASIPPSYVPRVVLLSDGNTTRGDPIVSAASGGVPIDTIPLPDRTEPEVQLASVSAPAQVRQGEPFYVEVTVNATSAGEGHVDVYRGDVLIGDANAKKVKLKPGSNQFRVRQTVTDQRQVTFAARARGFGDADTLLDNNESSALVTAAGRPKILLIDPDTDQTDSFRWALDEQRIDVEVRPTEGVPRSLTELQGYECLVLSNVPATAMTTRQMDIIRTYVQDLGGGLVMLGGDQSFGLGGYYRTQLEEILPVRSNFEKEREKPSLAMVLVIDKSGSMGGEKIELAKDAAKAAVELLGPRDSIGVISFDGSSYWVSELRSAGDRGYISDQISTIQASGGTNMYPAMSDAYEALNRASAKLKHCILLTDGISSPGDFEGLSSEMSASRMTISTVALGQGASEELLQDIARLGGGRYYFCDDPQSVPQVFAKETVEASKSAINELPFLPQLVRPTRVLEGIELDLAPLLLGYVVTRPKPTSEFVLASEAGDPLLVWWQYGLGRTVAFTSDAKARWAAEWLAWPDFGPFWAQVIRHAMRKSDSQGIFVELQQRDGSARIVMDAVDDDGLFVNESETVATVIGPRLKTEKIQLQQTAPGRYEATVPTAQQGAYQIDLAQTRLGNQSVRQTRGLVVGYPDELRLRPINRTTLQQIATSSGGRFEPALDSVIQTDGRTARMPLAMWPYLLMTAIAAFIADVAMRRIDLTTS